MNKLPAGGYFSNYSPHYCTMGALASPEKTYRMGYIATPHGVVGFYDQGRYGRDKPYTRLRLVTAGRLREASWQRTFSDRFLKTVAKRFAASIARGT